MGIPLQVFYHSGSDVSAGDKLCNPAFADGNHGKLCTGKKPVYEHQQQDYQQFDDYTVQSLPLQTEKFSLTAEQNRATRPDYGKAGEY